MYKFKNVKKLLIEFSRGEGLSVPTDSIRTVKVDGDELSGSSSGPGDSAEDEFDAKAFGDGLLAATFGNSDSQYYLNGSEYIAPDGYLTIGSNGFVEFTSALQFSVAMMSGVVLPIYHNKPWGVVPSQYNPEEGDDLYLLAPLDLITTGSGKTFYIHTIEFNGESVYYVDGISMDPGQVS